ncbi:hypothetical protein OD917_04825 [Flavobacterium sp. SH_e]|uniref:hypothetical protein n=1 Tax=Flavobacterium TaxID=237 RepID=UPI0021E4FDE9|nr:hypothetical protein [Flavobacterium sp. SH_e]MCV2484236.1 hypothetical protein [Flavobacterium sp. SH_e]
MIQRLLFSLEFILVDFFSTYGIIIIICLLLSIFIKNPILQKINNQSNRFITFIGIAYLIVFLLATIIELNISDEESKNYLLNRMFGKYWFGFWLQPLLWFSMSQLLRIKSIQKSILLKLIFSFFFIISIEKIVIIATSFHRDYLPSSWTMSTYSYSSNLFLELLIKFSIFLISAVFFMMITQKINDWKTIKTNSQ